MTRYSERFPGMSGEAEPCFWCCAIAMAHTLDDLQYHEAATKSLSNAVGALLNAMYAARAELPEVLPTDAVDERWSTHVKYRLRYCMHHETVDNPDDSSPF